MRPLATGFFRSFLIFIRGLKWYPNCTTVPNFGAIALKMRSLAGVKVLSFKPEVEKFGAYDFSKKSWTPAGDLSRRSAKFNKNLIRKKFSGTFLREACLKSENHVAPPGHFIYQYFLSPSKASRDIWAGYLRAKF